MVLNRKIRLNIIIYTGDLMEVKDLNIKMV